VEMFHTPKWQQCRKVGRRRRPRVPDAARPCSYTLALLGGGDGGGGAGGAGPTCRALPRERKRGLAGVAV
jgi:hypothetical protein